MHERVVSGVGGRRARQGDLDVLCVLLTPDGLTLQAGISTFSHQDQLVVDLQGKRPANSPSELQH